MDSPGKSADEKTQKKTASSVATKEGDSLVLVVAPATSELEKGERPSRRKKRRSTSHKRAPVSPEGPFPKGAAEIHPSELEYNPADSTTIIGKGMYGTVYEGRCRGLRVAIKVLNDQKMDAKSLRKFKDEVELMAGLNHTRVVLFLGACMLDNGKVACVTEYLPNGNLETVLESKDIQLTMLDKLKYARDIALGCNWLHHSNPVIIHRDLKPSNLLLDDNGRVKVCDFGLSLAQPEHSKGFRSSRIVGTPLYTSPETIKGKTITTKADVYSYGVVLWQILTRLEPFLECEDSDEVYEVVKKGQRPPLTVPPLPPETTPALRQLIADCWQNSPRKRPTFDEILTRLEVMLIEYAIPDPHGAELWKSRFLGKDEVSWPKFVSTFAEDDRFGAATISPHSPPVRCLKNLLATEASPTAVVTLKSFGDFCSWFGPLVPGVHDEQINITKKVVAILRCPWFHASVTNKQARSLLVHQPIGTFLVRYNESVRGGWIISYVAESSDDGSSEGLSDSRRKSRRSVASEKQVALAGGVDDEANGAKRGRIKHVRIYFDRSQPDLGYQLLLPAKPKALQDMPSPRQSAASSPASAGLVAGDQSQSSSSSSLGGGEGGETMGEAFKRYVWSSYTTYIVDFINQLLDKSWPGREYLDLHYPCPGSRFASIFAQSSPGEESSDSVLGGSVLVRYLNSMSSVDDLKRKDKKADDDASAAGDGCQLTGTAAATADVKASPHATTTAAGGVDDGGKSSRREQLWQKLQQNGREAKENGREAKESGGGGSGGGAAGEEDGAGARHVEKAAKKTKKTKKAKDGGEKPEKLKAKAKPDQPADVPAAATATAATADDGTRQPPADNGGGDATPRKKGKKKKEKKEKHHKDLNSKDRPKKEKKDKKEKKGKKEKEGAVAAAEDHAAAASATSTSTSQSPSPSPGKGSRRATKRLGSSKKAEAVEDVAEVAVTTTSSSTSVTASPEKKSAAASKKEGSRLFRRKTKEPLFSPTTDPAQGDDGKSKEAEPRSEKDEKAEKVLRKSRKRGLSLSSKRSGSKTDDTITSASSGAASSPLGTTTPSSTKRKEKKDKAKLAAAKKE